MVMDTINRFMKIFRMINEMVRSIVQINTRSQPILIISFSVPFNDIDVDET